MSLLNNVHYVPMRALRAVPYVPYKIDVPNVPLIFNVPNVPKKNDVPNVPKKYDVPNLKFTCLTCPKYKLTCLLKKLTCLLKKLTCLLNNLTCLKKNDVPKKNSLLLFFRNIGREVSHLQLRNVIAAIIDIIRRTENHFIKSLHIKK